MQVLRRHRPRADRRREVHRALLATTQSLTMAQLAEVTARLGLKVRLVITEMTEDESKDAAEKLAVKS